MPASSDGPFTIQRGLPDPVRAGPTRDRQLAICPLVCDNGQLRVGLPSPQPSANRLPGDLWRMAAVGGLQPVTPLSAGQHNGCPFTRARPPTPPVQRRFSIGGRSRHSIAGAPSHLSATFSSSGKRGSGAAPEATAHTPHAGSGLVAALYPISTSLSSEFDRSQTMEYNPFVCVP